MEYKTLAFQQSTKNFTVYEKVIFLHSMAIFLYYRHNSLRYKEKWRRRPYLFRRKSKSRPTYLGF